MRLSAAHLKALTIQVLRESRKVHRHPLQQHESEERPEYIISTADVKPVSRWNSILDEGRGVILNNLHILLAASRFTWVVGTQA